MYNRVPHFPSDRQAVAKSPIEGLEANLQELEKLLARMEAGEGSLAESLKDFERGIALTRDCQKALQEAEQRVEKLIEQDGGTAGEAFSPDE